jgi:hypothetical protein
MKTNGNLLKLCLLGLGLLLPATVRAQFTFTTNNGAITITGYTGSNSVVTIPDATNGYPVTVIDQYAFGDCLSLTSVTIPDTVTIIDPSAFFNCVGLTNVTIPASVNIIGEAAFSCCSSLTAINVNPANPYYTSVDGVLFDHSQTRLVGYPIGKTNTSYAIPDSVTDITGFVFEWSSLANITIGTNVNNIGNCAFSGSSLTNVTIPNSVTNLGIFPFGGCASLTAINVEPENPAFKSVNGVLFNRSLTSLVQYPGGPAGSYTIPNSVTRIVLGAFDGSSLTNILIPNGVTNIEFGSFSSCFSLVAITVDPSNPVYRSVNGVLFSNDQSTLILYPSANPYGDYTIPDGVTVIGDEAFGNCISLSTVTIPNSVVNIGNYQFMGCFNLSAFYVNSANPAYSSVSGVLFDKNQATLIHYPSQATNNNYTIPNGVTAIGDNAFEYCTNLNSVTIPNSVTNTGNGGFWNCFNLSALYFEGNAPGDDLTEFPYDNAIVYHLSGTMGWGATYGGLSTALWLPQAQTSDGSFGVQTNQFGFNINWASGQTVVVEASTNLSNPIWQPVQTNTLTSGTAYFSDPQWTNYPGRFYRLRSP